MSSASFTRHGFGPKTVDKHPGNAYSKIMNGAARSIILILAFALLIQNTCPLGAAGKSAVAASCGQCPFKHQALTPVGAQKNIISDTSVHFPMFVFSVPKTIHTVQLEFVQSIRPVLADRYQDAVPAEFLRPPQA